MREDTTRLTGWSPGFAKIPEPLVIVAAGIIEVVAEGLS